MALIKLHFNRALQLANREFALPATLTFHSSKLTMWKVGAIPPDRSKISKTDWPWAVTWMIWWFDEIDKSVFATILGKAATKHIDAPDASHAYKVWEHFENGGEADVMGIYQYRVGVGQIAHMAPGIDGARTSNMELPDTSKVAPPEMSL